jgi:hypothetical protein
MHLPEFTLSHSRFSRFSCMLMMGCMSLRTVAKYKRYFVIAKLLINPLNIGRAILKWLFIITMLYQNNVLHEPRI